MHRGIACGIILQMWFLMQNRLVLLGLTDQKRDVSEQGLINCQRPTAVENVQASHYHIYLFFVSSNHLSLSNQSRTVLIHWDVGIYGFQKNAAVLHDIFFITRTHFVSISIWLLLRIYIMHISLIEKLVSW